MAAGESFLLEGLWPGWQPGSALDHPCTCLLWRQTPPPRPVHQGQPGGSFPGPQAEELFPPSLQLERLPLAEPGSQAEGLQVTSRGYSSRQTNAAGHPLHLIQIKRVWEGREGGREK